MKALTRHLASTLVVLAMTASSALAQEGEGEGEETGDTEETDEAAQDAQSMMTDDSSLDDQAARQYFNAGRNLYDLGRFTEAAEQFQQAYDLSQRAPLLYNIYLAHRDASQDREAATALRLYLEQMPEIENRQSLQVRLDNLERAIAEQDAEREAAAREAEAAVRAEHEQRDREEAARRRREEENAPSPVPWIVAGVGGVMVIVGAITGGVALGLASDLEENCDDLGDGTFACDPDDDDLRDKQSSLSTMATLTDVMIIGGAVVAVAGVTWGLIQMLSGGGEEETPAVSAMCGPTGCGASVRVGF
jgi:tetratricopeptide (TPR) repeat protein